MVTDDDGRNARAIESSIAHTFAGSIPIVILRNGFSKSIASYKAIGCRCVTTPTIDHHWTSSTPLVITSRSVCIKSTCLNLRTSGHARLIAIPKSFDAVPINQQLRHWLYAHANASLREKKHWPYLMTDPYWSGYTRGSHVWIERWDECTTHHSSTNASIWEQIIKAVDISHSHKCKNTEQVEPWRVWFHPNDYWYLRCLLMLWERSDLFRVA